MDQKAPTAVIESARRGLAEGLPFHNTSDFEAADRGFTGALEPCVVKAADGRVVWDNDAYAFLASDAPTSVHPSLWLVHRKVESDPETAQATVTLANKARLLSLAAGDQAAPGLEITGDASAGASLTAVFDQPDPNFNIITP